jgi:5-(carboxyamino)imidazole ribonucleotide synthase
MTRIDPGSTIGVLGGGQLGRMMTLAAKQMGYRVLVFTASLDSPAGQVADDAFIASLTDDDTLNQFLAAVDVVTLETENVPLAVLQHCAERVPTRPSVVLLDTAQDRIHEKSRLSAHGYPVPQFWPITSDDDAERVAREVVGTRVLKTATGGYDGKGQSIVRTPDELQQAWRSYVGSRRDEPASESDLAGAAARMILEEFVPFRSELSVLAARSPDGQIVSYGPIENRHHRHILDVSVCPALVAPRIAHEAIAITQSVAEQFGLEGVFCIEFFLTDDDRLLINEIAPRPHNSGHLTIDAHATSQFEQQVRAITNLPLGAAQQIQPAAMANLLGDIWLSQSPNWSAALSDPGVKLHLYGKCEPRAGRKMGHLTAVGEDAERRVIAARERAMRSG